MLLGLAIVGCGSDGVRKVPPSTTASSPKTSFTDAVKSNPNIPDAAKKSMLGSGAAPK